ncbi:MAG TPA: SRPBCC family protein [Fimbriimonadaceae bacterium]|jgi:hypothetical protein
MTETHALAILKDIVVKVPQDFAFNIFANNMTKWWPEDHHIGATDFEEVVLEPKAGGRWFEKGKDGVECDWGKVLAYEPFDRVLLAWQLDENFVFNAALHTEVEILFHTLGPEETRVTLEHRKLENYGEAGAKMQRMFDADNAWISGLKLFAAYVESVKS